MQKLREFLELNTDNLTHKVYTDSPWHEHLPIYDSNDKANQIPESVLDSDIVYLFVDGDAVPPALVIEVNNP